MTDIRLFKGTPAWDLANAVDEENTNKIESILLEEPELANFQESQFGSTLLMWSIGMEKYNSAEKLLEMGADPDISTYKYGETPLFQASGYSWIDTEASGNPKYVQLLLNYGADPNKNFEGNRDSKVETGVESTTSPLMNSVGAGIEKTKLLIEAGADINHKTLSGTSAAQLALYYDNDPSYAHYLIVEKKATVSEPYYRTIQLDDYDLNEELYLVDLLRYWVYDLDSEEYSLKMDIVEEFARQGFDYWATMIPEKMLEYIKKRFPNSWVEYTKKY